MSNNDVFNKQIKQLNQLTKKLPAQVGSIAVRHFKTNFKRQGFLNKKVEKWKPRKLKDKNKRGKRAILVKTGQLKRSIRVVRKTTNSARIATNIPYAKIHNDGGTIKGNVKVRSHSRKTASGAKARVKAHSRKVNTTIPKRQFMGDSKALTKEVATHIENKVNEIFN